jgi:hypothetical protein
VHDTAQEQVADLGSVSRARTLVGALGGRFSLELGIDVDGDQREIERWALASTLLGTSVPVRPLRRSWHALRRAGVETIAAAGEREREDLVALLGAGRRRRYAERTAERLHFLATALVQRHGLGLISLGETLEEPHELECTLVALPGWGPATVRTFLRELRGVWPGARPPLGTRAANAAEHAHLPSSLPGLGALAIAAHLDLRDLEAGLYRLAASHPLATCPGGEECSFVSLDPQQYVRV